MAYRHEAPDQSSDPSVYRPPQPREEQEWPRGGHRAPEAQPFLSRLSTKIGLGVAALGLAAGAGAVGVGVANSGEARATDGGDRETSADPAPGYEQNPSLLDNQEQQVDVDPETLDPQYWFGAEYVVGGETYNGYEELRDAKSLKTENYLNDLTPERIFLSQADRENGEVSGAAVLAEDFFAAMNDRITTLTEPGAEEKWSRFGEPENPEQDRRELVASDVISPAYAEMYGSVSAFSENVYDMHIANLGGASYNFVPKPQSITGGADFFKGVDNGVNEPEDVPLEVVMYLNVDIENGGEVAGKRLYTLSFAPVEIENPDGTTDEVYKLQDATWENLDLDE